ncbi:hypothetical protein F5Y14DRAFT_434369 [Nemania sp. NC0429]|nr:hypothetical protein F5Y14DRAFT_434369 [Nemania sp. NC0429]
MSSMLTDKEIDDASEKLAEFRARSAEEDFLQRYADLLVSYRQLKSDLEEEKLTRERYKQLARTQERSPFVLVLVDGDGYIFNDRFLQSGADGGSMAAKYLNDAVEQSLRGKGIDNCEIMIRVYANLANLSRTLSRNGLATADKRSLSPFVASFNRAYGLTEFIDAGELKENADFKIRALLGLYAENAQCKHIFIAACHDVGYLADLTRFRGDRSRVTLIRSSGLLFHNRFFGLELGVEEFPGVFRTVQLPSDAPTSYTKPNASTDLVKGPHPTGPSTTGHTTYYQGNGSRDSQKPCPFYQTGKCRFGADCKNAHIDNRTSMSASSARTPFPSQLNNHDDHNNADATGGFSRARNSAIAPLFESDGPSPNAMPGRRDLADSLPMKREIPDGHIAVNNALQRLDAYMPVPSPATSAKLRELSINKRFCNSRQLTGFCPNKNCIFEHDPLPEDLLPALEWLSRSLPCLQRRDCKSQACVLGHICQNMECQYRGGKTKCKLPAPAHRGLVFDHYEPAASPVDPVNTTNPTNSPTATSSPNSGYLNHVDNWS